MKTILFILLTFICCASFAGTQSSLPLKGKIALLLGIEITPTPAALLLDLTQSQTNLKVASGKLFSNSGSGFKVTVSSSNQGKLKRIGGNNLFPYAMKFGPVDVPLSSTAEFVYPLPLNYTDDITVSYTGVPASNLIAGDYIDTITFTISAL
ncbi:MAG: hypothetical protein V4598_17805 [Bdellovibrionota bacterium]